MELVGLKKARNKKGLSQLKVAMDLSITREALSYYENGKRSPDVDMLVKLARYFGVSVDYIIFGED
jgi:transcriptional regulator with XRE-family HTH domain